MENVGREEGMGYRGGVRDEPEYQRGEEYQNN